MQNHRRAFIFLILLFTAALPASGPAAAGKGAAIVNDPAELVPATAILYAHTASVEKTLGALNFVLNKFFAGKAPVKAGKWREEFKSKTGMDPLDPVSLSRAGIDTGRPAAAAYLNGESDKEKILILIPVRDGKKSPQLFVDVLKKYYPDKPEADLNPVITSYKNHQVFRMLEDLYFCSVDGYLLLAPAAVLIHSVIDMRGDTGAGFLAADGLFLDYTAKRKKENHLGVYMKRSFLSEYGKRKIKKEERREEGNKNDDDLKEGGKDGSDDGGDVPGKKNEGPDTGMKERVMPGLGKTEMWPVEYFAAGVSGEGRGLSLDVSMSMIPGDVSTRIMEKLFKTGLPENLMVMEKPLAYYFLSLDLKAMDELCGSGEKTLEKSCRDFTVQIEKLGKSAGIDFRAEVLPYFGGFFNMMMRKSRLSRTMDNFVFFIPMSDPEAGKNLWKKLRNAAKKANEKDNRFGDEKIDNIPSFWYKDRRGNRVNVLAFGKGIYAANNAEFLRGAMFDDKGPLKNSGAVFIAGIDPGTFLLTYLRFEDESYLKTVLMLLTYKTSPELSKFLNRLGEMFLVGRRDGVYYSYRLTLNLADDDS